MTGLPDYAYLCEGCLWAEAADENDEFSRPCPGCGDRAEKVEL